MNQTHTSRQEKAEQTRAHIVSTALALFAERGFAATSTRRIAQAAGISEGLIFHHFPNKQALLMAVSASRSTLAGEIAKLAEFGNELAAEDCLRAVGLRFVAMLDSGTEDGKMVAMMIGEAQTNPELHVVFRGLIDSASASLGDYFKVRIEAGELREDLGTEHAARTFLGSLMLFFMTNSHLDSAAWASLASQHVEELVDLWIEGARRK